MPPICARSRFAVMRAAEVSVQRRRLQRSRNMAIVALHGGSESCPSLKALFHEKS
jgi:hypothetical protein